LRPTTGPRIARSVALLEPVHEHDVDRAALGGGEHAREPGSHAAASRRRLLDLEHDAQAACDRGGPKLRACQSRILLTRADSVVESGSKPTGSDRHDPEILAGRPGQSRIAADGDAAGGRVTSLSMTSTRSPSRDVSTKRAAITAIKGIDLRPPPTVRDPGRVRDGVKRHPSSKARSPRLAECFFGLKPSDISHGLR
jgi:hypothetical protein